MAPMQAFIAKMHRTIHRNVLDTQKCVMPSIEMPKQFKNAPYHP